MTKIFVLQRLLTYHKRVEKAFEQQKEKSLNSGTPENLMKLSKLVGKLEILRELIHDFELAEEPNANNT